MSTKPYYMHKRHELCGRLSVLSQRLSDLYDDYEKTTPDQVRALIDEFAYEVESVADDLTATRDVPRAF